MARFKGKILTGIVGNIVIKNYRGMQVVTSKPVTPQSHITENTMKTAGLFGKGSNFVSTIRLALEDVISKKPEGTLGYRFNGQMFSCLNMARNSHTDSLTFKENTFNGLAGLELNDLSPMRKNLFTQPEVEFTDTHLLVKLPDINMPGDIKFPKDATLCKFVVNVAFFDIFNGKWFTAETQTLDIPVAYKKVVMPAHEFSFELQHGCLCITAIGLQFFEQTFLGYSLLNNKTFNPSAILNATLLDGDPDMEVDSKWDEMDFMVQVS